MNTTPVTFNSNALLNSFGTPNFPSTSFNLNNPMDSFNSVNNVNGGTPNFTAAPLKFNAAQFNLPPSTDPSQFNLGTLLKFGQIGTGIAGTFLGFKQFAEAKRQNKVNEQLARANFAANRNITNQQLGAADTFRRLRDKTNGTNTSNGLNHAQFLAKFGVQPLKQTP